MNNEDIITTCPHCNAVVAIPKDQTNCRIFRHGIRTDTWQQVNPHLPKEQCDALVAEGKVIGCCKPYRLDENNEAVPCEYI